MSHPKSSLHSCLLCVMFCCVGTFPVVANPPRLEQVDVFPAGMSGVALYRIPGIVVTAKGTVLAYCEARKNSGSDWGEIEVQLRRSIDGGKSWQPAQKICAPRATHRGEPSQASRWRARTNGQQSGGHHRSSNGQHRVSLLRQLRALFLDAERRRRRRPGVIPLRLPRPLNRCVLVTTGK